MGNFIIWDFLVSPQIRVLFSYHHFSMSTKWLIGGLDSWETLLLKLRVPHNPKPPGPVYHQLIISWYTPQPPTVEKLWFWWCRWCRDFFGITPKRRQGQTTIPWLVSGKKQIPAHFLGDFCSLPLPLGSNLKNPLMIVLGRANYYSQNPQPGANDVYFEGIPKRKAP